MVTRAANRSKWFRRTSLARAIGWAALTPVAYFAGWLDSVAFVSLLSLWALAETAFSAWRSDENPDQERLERIESKLDDLTRV